MRDAAVWLSGATRDPHSGEILALLHESAALRSRARERDREFAQSQRNAREAGLADAGVGPGAVGRRWLRRHVRSFVHWLQDVAESIWIALIAPLYMTMFVVFRVVVFGVASVVIWGGVAIVLWYALTTW